MSVGKTIFDVPESIMISVGPLQDPILPTSIPVRLCSTSQCSNPTKLVPVVSITLWSNRLDKWVQVHATESFPVSVVVAFHQKL